jgi:serine/threonine-protein kinase
MSVETGGKVLGGRYRVERVLGSGGMATVFLCQDERLGRRVAVKRLHAHSPDETAQRFVREAKLGASLNHPNLVSVYDTVTDEEGVLIVMELVQGETLADAIRRGPLPTAQALSVIRAVASGLDHAHGHGIVHRDIKPANVLVREDGVTKLTDLGIATAADHTKITSSGIVLGTAAYMAPEQLEGGEAGPPVDIYSLSVLAFEALSGRKARQGRTPMEIAHEVAVSGPPDIQEVWSEAPPEAAEVLCRGMARDPRDRPSSAGVLADELEEALEGVRDTRATLRRERTAGAAATGAAGGLVAAAPAAAAAPHAAPPAAARDTDRVSAASDGGDSGYLDTRRREGPPRPPRRPGLPVLIAVTLLALAFGAALAAILTSGGDDKPAAERANESAQKPDTSERRQTQPPQTEEEQQPAEEEQAPAQSEEQPAPSGGGTDPARGRQLNDQGFQRMKQGDFAGAVPILQQAVSSFPEDSQDINYAYALFNLGKSLNRSGRPDEAIPYLEKRLNWPSQHGTVKQELESARKAAGEG